MQANRQPKWQLHWAVGQFGDRVGLWAGNRWWWSELDGRMGQTKRAWCRVSSSNSCFPHTHTFISTHAHPAQHLVSLRCSEIMTCQRGGGQEEVHPPERTLKTHAAFACCSSHGHHKKRGEWVESIKKNEKNKNGNKNTKNDGEERRGGTENGSGRNARASKCWTHIWKGNYVNETQRVAKQDMER